MRYQTGLVLHLAALATALSGVLPIAQAQSYPTRPVRLIVGFAPGGPTDVVARAIAPRVGEMLGQSVVVDNKPGASGNIGAEFVARSTPDGHTLLFGDVTFIVNPSLFKSAPFNPEKDFVPVALPVPRRRYSWCQPISIRKMRQNSSNGQRLDRGKFPTVRLAMDLRR